MCLFVLSSAIGQETFYHHYTAKDNLPHDITYQIIQDDKGVIWIGTDDGLSKFNGTSFVNYSYENGLRSNYVINIVQDVKKDYYIGTWGGGLHKLKNDSIYPLTTLDRNHKIKKVLKLNDSILYTFGNYRIYKYNLKRNTFKKLEIYSDSSTPETLALNKNGLLSYKELFYSFDFEIINDEIVLFSAQNVSKRTNPLQGVYILKEDNLIPFFENDLKNTEVHSITKDATNNLYITSFNKVFCYQNNQMIGSLELPLKNHKIFNLKIVNQYLYFIASNPDKGSRKMYMYDLKKKQLRNFSKELNIHSLVSDFLIDKNDGLWITTYGQGLYHIPKLESQFFGKPFFKNPDLKDMVKYNDTFMVLSTNDLYGLKNDSLIASEKFSFHSEYLQANPWKKSIHLISPHEGKMQIKNDWDFNLSIENMKSFEFENKSVGFRFQGNELSCYEEGQLIDVVKIHPLDSHARNAVIYEGKIYVVYDRVGVYVFDRESAMLLEIWNKKSGFYTDMYRDLVVFENQLWFASDVGIVKVEGDKHTRYTTQNGLSSNHINDIFIDQYGVVWAGTQKGLNVLYNDSFYTLDESVGQQSTFITKVLEDGNYIYASGNKGLFKYKNTKAYQPFSNTSILITQDGTSFNVNSINYLNPGSLEMEYSVDAAKWQKLVSQTLTFDQLKQGNYELQVRAKDATSAWIYSKKYPFKIQLPWHQQLWLYIVLIVLALGGILYVVYQQLLRAKRKNVLFQNTLKEREKLQLELQNVRHQIAQDFHDDLGNKLASISIASGLLTKNYTASDATTKTRLEQIKSDADTLYSGMRDFIWSLNYKNNKLSELQMYLSDFGEELFENSTIVFKSYNNIPDEDVLLSYYWNKQLVLIFKEAMTNALKHSEASEVIFSVLLEKDELSIYVSDNGKGLGNKISKKINGLQNMKDRADSIHGSLTFVNENGLTILFATSIKNISK